MRKINLLFFICCFTFCKHKAVEEPIAPTPISSGCLYDSNSTVSFTAVILPLLKNNCGDCHTPPGSGGINLDNYSGIKAIASSGELTTVVNNTDPNNIMMPPPPLHHLDSCQRTAIYLWISQGALDN